MKWYLAGGVCSTSGRSSPDSKCDLQEATCVPRLLGEWMTSLTYSQKGSFWPLISFFFLNFEIIVYRYEIKRSEAERSQVAVPTDSHTLKPCHVSELGYWCGYSPDMEHDHRHEEGSPCAPSQPHLLPPLPRLPTSPLLTTNLPSTSELPNRFSEWLQRFI